MNELEVRNYREQAAAIAWGALGAGTRNHAIAERLRRQWAAVWAGCTSFEWIAFGYLAVSSVLIAAFAHNLLHPLRLIAVQAFVAAVILSLNYAELRSRDAAAQRGDFPRSGAHGFWHFWRHWYPHLFFLFGFEELGYLVHLVYRGWYNAQLIAFDHWLTGVHPAVWLEQFATPVRNDFVQFAYITYFSYLLILGGILYYRREWRDYWSVMTYSGAAYVVGYLISIFYPAESPWHAMAGAWHAELRGGPFTALINFIEHYGRVRGAAFPSEHVAGSVAALWGAWRHRRWLFWVFLPFVICMCFSTVYCRYHYVADVLGGIITGTLGYWIGRELLAVRGAVPGEQ